MNLSSMKTNSETTCSEVLGTTHLEPGTWVSEACYRHVADQLRGRKGTLQLTGTNSRKPNSGTGHSKTPRLQRMRAWNRGRLTVGQCIGSCSRMRRSGTRLSEGVPVKSQLGALASDDGQILR